MGFHPPFAPPAFPTQKSLTLAELDQHRGVLPSTIFSAPGPMLLPVSTQSAPSADAKVPLRHVYDHNETTQAGCVSPGCLLDGALKQIQ